MTVWIAPAIEREIRGPDRARAEDGTSVYSKESLEQLLMQPPIAGQVVLGWIQRFGQAVSLLW